MPPKNSLLKSNNNPNQTPEISTYYRDKFFKNLSDTKILEKIEAEFFEETKLRNCSKSEILDFLNVIKTAGSASISENNLPKLLSKINQLIFEAQVPSSIAEISLVLEALAKTQHEKYQLQELQTASLVNIFNQQENLTSSDIVQFFKACAKFSYDKDELEIDIPKLVGAINLKFGSFSVGEKITFLNSLAKLGYDINHNQLKPVFERFTQSIIKEISYCNETQIDSLVHLLAKMEMFDEIFIEQDDQKILRREIANFFTFEKINNLSSDLAFSLLQAHMYCDLLHATKLFDETTLNAIADKYIPREVETSKLQQKFAQAFSQKGYKVEEEFPVYEIKGKAIRSIDIKLTTEKDGSSHEYFIEVDGPTHFLLSAQDQLIEDSATRKRDRINKKAIREISTLSQCKYAKLSFKQDIENLIERSEVVETNFYEASLKPAAIAVQDNSKKQQYETSVATEEGLSSLISSLSLEGKTTKNNNKSGKPSSQKSKLSSSTKKQNALTIPEQFQQAIEQKNTSAIENLIRNGFDINANLPNNLNPFSFAIECAKKDFFGVIDVDYMKIYSILVSAGADVGNYQEPIQIEQKASKGKKNKPPKAQENSLQIICNQSLTKEYESLFCALAKLDSVSLDHQQSITEAVNSGSAKIVDAVVSKDGFNSNSPEAGRALNLVVERLALENSTKDDLEILDVLINKAKIESKEIDNSAAKKILKKSSDEGYFKVFMSIIDGVFDKNKRIGVESLEQSKLVEQLVLCLDQIISYQTSEDLEEVMDIGINMLKGAVNDDEKYFELLRRCVFYACYHGNETALKNLIQKGSAGDIVNSCDNNFKIPPINISCQRGKESIVEILLKNGADIESLYCDDKGETRTPLFSASQNGHLKVVKVLVSAAGDQKSKIINSQDNNNGSTALMVSSQFGQYEVTKFLVENGADLDKQGSEGFTALMAACNHGRKEIVELLVKNGAKLLSLRDKRNYDVMHYAIMYGYYNKDMTMARIILEEVYKELPDRGVKIGNILESSLKNENGEEEKDLAKILKKMSIMVLLLEVLPSSSVVSNNHSNLAPNSSKNKG